MKIERAKHTLAKLRITLGLGQKQMAELLEVSLATIQSIETGRLQLSKKLATRAEFETGIDAEWLLANDLSKAIEWFLSERNLPERVNWSPYKSFDDFFRTNSCEGLFRHHLKMIRNFRTENQGKVIDVHVFWLQVIRLIAVTESAIHKGKRRLCEFKIDQMIQDLESEFGSEQKICDDLKIAIHCAAGTDEIIKPKSVLPIQELSKRVSTVFLRRAKLI
ncbi:MAG TPA: helix-turn-helix transcriptional regulator [Candidatus Saccharimonadales bacterium]|nr:helix-turn-helix transcriptional regulator [Candidatus Saccharimonadales bacterium]